MWLGVTLLAVKEESKFRTDLKLFHRRGRGRRKRREGERCISVSIYLGFRTLPIVNFSFTLTIFHLGSKP